MQDLGPAAMVTFLGVFEIIRNVFKRHGARSIETSHLQVRGGEEMFYGSCADKIVNIDDPGGGGGERESLCLRYDLTFPMIRYIINNGINHETFCQFGPSFRLLPNGSSQQIYQCDFDMIGQHEPMVSDAVCMHVIYSALCELGYNMKCFEIRVNHSKLLKGILSCYHVPAHLHSPLKSILRLPDVSIERIEEVGIERENAAKLHHYLTMTGGMDLVQTLQEDETLNQHLDVLEALREMEKFLNYCTNELHIPSETCVFHLNLVRELDYYNGLIFEAVSVEPGECRKPSKTLACGGRYDDLISKCRPGLNVPGVGFTLVMESITSDFLLSIEESPEGRQGPSECVFGLSECGPPTPECVFGLSECRPPTPDDSSEVVMPSLLLPISQLPRQGP